MKEVILLLPRLYASELVLPDIFDNEVEVESERLSYEEWFLINQRVAVLIGENNLYFSVIDPFKDESPNPLILSDDLTDIYGDLVNGLNVYKKGTESYVFAALWEWRFNFNAHWGEHLVRALHTLHSISNNK